MNRLSRSNHLLLQAIRICKFATTVRPADKSRFACSYGPAAQPNGRNKLSLTRRILAIFCALTVASILGLPGTANAKAPAGDAAITAAWDCPVGDICIWSGDNGTGSRCNWANADNDWRSGSIACSWSATSPVKSMWNRGTSSSYTVVALYHGADYSNLWGCLGQNGGNWTGIGVYLRSHRWASSCN
ncbi:peptidase inhibitor family I36 protein [Micromonospora sp. NPDC023814]|uniref:peptidase inhibitor family I36 protein n=1 Tax=Micromonospora sp. NPDC023814 TaxID=3154596 RepID=UPI0033C37BFE